MKHFVLLTNIVSPHQLPLMEAIWAHLGRTKAAYVFTEAIHEERRALGWGKSEIPAECFFDNGSEHVNAMLQTCDVLLAGNRAVELFEAREIAEKKTFYMSERWFKPSMGILRIFHPRYFMMASRIVRLIRRGKCFFYLPIGIHAARDMARLCGLLGGRWRCFFAAPKLVFESKPGGRIMVLQDAITYHVLTEHQIYLARKHGFVQVDTIPDRAFSNDSALFCLEKMYLWGYFVFPGQPRLRQHKCKGMELTILWVGRLLKLKRVNVLIRAVSFLNASGENLSLTVVGDGPEEKALRVLSRRLNGNVSFLPSRPVEEIRDLMRTHDLYVFASNAYEGWGAVVNEALEEGMAVIGTYEAGSSATMLHESLCYHAGNTKALIQKIRTYDKSAVSSFVWRAETAAEVLLSL